MSVWFRAVLSVGIAIALFALFWRSLFWVGAIPALLLGSVVWLAMDSDRGKRWRDYALIGAAAGALVGGPLAFVLVLFVGWGAVEGWEGLQAIVAGMVWAVGGAIIGMCAGAVAGSVTDLYMRRRNKSPDNQSLRGGE